MNKFSRIVLGLKALLGQKAPSSAVTDTSSQLDWDNHSISLEDGEWWINEVEAVKPMPKEWVGKVVFVPEADPFMTCTSCNNDKFVGQNKVEAPFVCGWCQAEDAYVGGLIKAEKAAMVQSDAMLLREIALDRDADTEFRILSGESLSDAVDRHAKPPF